VKSISPRDRSKIFSMASLSGLACKRSRARIEHGKIGIGYIHICSGIASLYGALMAECL